MVVSCLKLTSINFNTSYVVIKPAYNDFVSRLNSYFNTSYVVIKPGLQCSRGSEKPISIHLMLLLNLL